MTCRIDMMPLDFDDWLHLPEYFQDELQNAAWTFDSIDFSKGQTWLTYGHRRGELLGGHLYTLFRSHGVLRLKSKVTWVSPSARRQQLGYRLWRKSLREHGATKASVVVCSNAGEKLIRQLQFDLFSRVKFDVMDSGDL